MAIERLVGHFGAVVDPRCRGKVEHRLTDILVIAVCAVIACAESWNDIALYGRSKLGWLAGGRLRTRGGRHRRQDTPTLVRPQARARAAAPGECLGQRAGPRAGP